MGKDSLWLKKHCTRAYVWQVRVICAWFCRCKRTEWWGAGEGREREGGRERAGRRDGERFAPWILYGVGQCHNTTVNEMGRATKLRAKLRKGRCLSGNDFHQR